MRMVLLFVVCLFSKICACFVFPCNKYDCKQVFFLLIVSEGVVALKV